jgi:hypothetical protein
MSTTQASVAAREAITANLKDKFPNLFVLPETSAHVRLSLCVPYDMSLMHDFVSSQESLI